MSGRIRSKSADGIQKTLSSPYVKVNAINAFNGQGKKSEICGKDTADRLKNVLYYAIFAPFSLIIVMYLAFANILYYARFFCLHRPRRTDQSTVRMNGQTAEQKEIDELKKQVKEMTMQRKQFESSMANKFDEQMEKLRKESVTQLKQYQSFMVSKTDEQQKRLESLVVDLVGIKNAVDGVRISSVNVSNRIDVTDEDLKQLELKSAEKSGGIENRLLIWEGLLKTCLEINCSLQNDLNFLKYSTGAKRHLMYFVFNAHHLEKATQVYYERFTFGDAYCDFDACKSNNNLVMVMRANNFSSMPFGSSFTVRLLGTKGDVCHTINELTSSFDILSWELFFEPANGFLDNDGIAVAEFDFTGLNFMGLKCAAIPPEFKPNASILIHNRPILVNKELLASESSYFKELFDGKHGKMEFSDIKVPEFVCFLDVIYELLRTAQDRDGFTSIIVAKLEGILQLASRFNAPKVIKQCEQFMKQCFSMEKNLVLAYKYRLKHFLDYCVEHCRQKGNFDKVISIDEYKSLDEDDKKSLTKLLI